MKQTVVNESARTGDYVIVVMKKQQHVPFQGHTIVALNLLVQMKQQKNIWARARATLSPFSPYACDIAVLRKYVGYNFKLPPCIITISHFY